MMSDDLTAVEVESQMGLRFLAIHSTRNGHTLTVAFLPAARLPPPPNPPCLSLHGRASWIQTTVHRTSREPHPACLERFEANAGRARALRECATQSEGWDVCLMRGFY